jgi:transposase
MEIVKKGKVRQLYEADFKDELIRMMNSGKNVQEISETFGIRRNVLYSWKMKSNTKVKVKNSEDQSSYSLKIIAENEALKKENARLQMEHDILKKALGLFSKSS